MSGGSMFESIELKMAYLERANQDLSDVVYRQQQQIQRLEARITALAEQFESLKDQPPPFDPKQERPPHY